MTYKDPEKQRAFQRQWQREQRIKRRITVIELLGGRCKKCGYCKNISALQIDHVNPILRDGSESNYSCQDLVNRIYRKLESTENLQLLCANCHAIKTYEEDRVRFGSYNNEVFKPSKTKTEYYNRGKKT